MSDTNPGQIAELEAGLIWGQTVQEQAQNGVWKGEGSAPSWVIGEGHVPLDEARARALQGVVEAEGQVISYLVAYDEACKRRTEAIKLAQRCETNLSDARERLARAQQDLARRCGVLLNDGSTTP